MSFPHHGKVLFSATLVRGHITKFHIPYLKWFKEQGWETWVAAKNDYPDGVCEIPYCDHFVNIDFARSPFSKQTLTAYRQLRKLFTREHFDIVHTHTPVGGVLTRLAARNARRRGTKVIYTAHGFHFYTGAPLINWILWYPVERGMSRLTDVLITINQEDYKRAKRFAHCQIEYVPGVGVDLSRCACVKNREGVRASLGVSRNDFVVILPADATSYEASSSVVRALNHLPSSVRLLVSGSDAKNGKLKACALRFGVSDRIVFLDRTDISANVLSASDCYVFPSGSDCIPVSMLEAVASGVPLIVGTSTDDATRHAIHDGVNVISVDPECSQAIAGAINRLLCDPSLSRRLSDAAIREGVENGIAHALSDSSLAYAEGGCSLLTRMELGCGEDDILLLSVGDLNSNKNHEVLVRALKLLPENYHLAIAGEGELRGYLQEIADDLGIRDRFELLGFRRDVNRLMNAADVFCFPSMREGLPVSVIEAMATGTPCVTSTARGCSDIAEGVINGYLLISDNSPATWAREIQSIIAGDANRFASQLISKAECYSSDSLLPRYRSIYEGAIA